MKEILRMIPFEADLEPEGNCFEMRGPPSKNKGF